ncbi:MAG: C40 family peptidase, partial [Eubacterium sp.]|nr:C40 family peptidase [Eubacterium sp.]
MKSTNCRARCLHRAEKRILSIIISLAMLLSITAGLDFSAYAATGGEIVSYARQFIGYPYVWGTQGPNSFDCSGFVQYVFKHFGISLPASSSSYWNYPTYYGTVVGTGSTANAQAGDVISWSGHVAIYTENGYCIEALNPDCGVCENKVNAHTNGMNYKVIRINGVSAEPIYSQKPSNVKLSLEKTSFYASEHITYYCSGNDVSYYVISIYSDKGDLLETVRVNPGEYCTRYYNPGSYIAYCEAFNACGKTFSNNIKFSVKQRCKTHSWNSGKTTKSATCTAAGTKLYTCTVCGETKTEKIKAKGHTTVIDRAVSATCTENGKTEGSHCLVCNAVIKKQETIKATGHKAVTI